jgi:glutamyl-tRNA reductase
LVLSTCNRVEVYAEVDKFHGGLAQASELLARRAGVDLDELTPHLYVHYEDRAVSHLFSVACGLDSMVVGESQVLGQVRLALRTAQDAGAAGHQLGSLAQQALRVGKRARTETGIDRAGRSLVTAGLEVAGQVLGPLDGTEVLVVGAGAMSALAATVVALRDMADSVVRAELVRLTGRLPDLDPHARAEIEQTVTRVVDKLLHAPTVRVKQLAEEPGGQSYADALNKLFGLDPKAVEAVTRADVASDPTPGGAS